MSQTYVSQANLMNPTQPIGIVQNQNPIGMTGMSPNTYVSTNTNFSNNNHPNMIMATPVVTNNQPQIQNQPQITNQGNYQQTYLPGRLTNSPDEIGIIEVPMNCDMAVFPKPDHTEIYVKYWTEQGVQTETFVRKDPEGPAINASESDILNALNNIMERLGKLESANQTKTSPKKVNKEESAS